jgi:hypothetical protein
MPKKNSSTFSKLTNQTIMHTKIALLLTLALLWSCSPRQAVNKSIPQNSDPINVEVNIDTNSSAEFIITNQSDSLIKIFRHYKLEIEKQDGDNWVPQRILHCPCGAPCAKPAEYIDLKAGKNLVKRWNLEESWCGEKINKPVPETITASVTPGVYRIMILYGITERETNTFYKEFTIK